MEKPEEVTEGLGDITSEVDNIKSLEMSLSTVFMEDLSVDVEGNLSVRDDDMYLCDFPFSQLSDSYLDILDNLLSVNETYVINSNDEANTSSRSEFDKD